MATAGSVSYHGWASICAETSPIVPNEINIAIEKLIIVNDDEMYWMCHVLSAIAYNEWDVSTVNEREELSVSCRARRLKQRRIYQQQHHTEIKTSILLLDIHTFNRLLKNGFEWSKLSGEHTLASVRTHTYRQTTLLVLISMHAKRITEPPLARRRCTIAEKGRWRHIQHVAACGWVALHTCYADTFNENEQKKKKNRLVFNPHESNIHASLCVCVCGYSCSVYPVIVVCILFSLILLCSILRSI